MELIQGLPTYIIIITIIVGLLLYIGFRLYRKIILPVALLKENGLKQQKVLIKIEIIVWAIFFTAVAYFALKASLVITLVLLLLILLAFFDFFRNFFPGLAIKFGDNFELGDHITVNEVQGKVIDFGYRSIKLITAKGEEILMPYRLINSAVKIEQKSVPKVLFKSLVIEDNKHGAVDFKQRIRETIYTNPWIIISSPVNISITGNQATLDFYTLNNDLYEKARLRLLKDLGQE
jgi:hypothetical protein